MIKYAAKLNAFSRGPRGFFVKLEIAPDDDWQELAAANLGQAFAVVMVPIDPETGERADTGPGSGAASALPTGQQRGEAGKPRKPWNEMSRAQQAGIYCNDPKFQLWISAKYWDGQHDPETVAKDAAAFVRNHCAVHSRADLDSNDLAARRWDALVLAFRQDTGQMAEAR